MRNGLARISESRCVPCRRTDARDLQITATIAHDAMGQADGNEAGNRGSRFRPNCGAVGQGSAFGNRDLFVAVAAVHGHRRFGWKRGRAHGDRRAMRARLRPSVRSPHRHPWQWARSTNGERWLPLPGKCPCVGSPVQEFKVTCFILKQRAQHFAHSPLNNTGTSSKSRFVDDDDTPCETREGHHANRPALDRGRATSTT